MSSVLPYIDDYRALLQRLARLGAPHLLLTQLAVGHFATYAARQRNLPGQTMAYWMINQGELVDNLNACGYALAHESQAGPYFAQDNYPAHMRVGRMWNMLFIRDPASSGER
jgi:hypothetical protein